MFADWRDIVSASTEASLESLWAAFLVASGLAIGRRAWRMSPRPLFPNFYVLLLGQTGDSRKSTCLWLASEFLQKIGEDTRLLEGVVSTEGLVDALAVREETKALIYSDEFRALLVVARRKGTQDILPRLNSLYYCPEKSTVDRVKNPTTAIRPFVSLISATPQEYVDDLLCDLDVTGGFLNRFLIITGDEQAPKPIVKSPSGDPWDRLAMKVQIACDKASGHIEFSSDALEQWKDFYIGWKNGRRKLEHRKAQLTARIFEYVLKIATNYAVLNGEDVISLRSLNIAIDVGAWIETNTLQLFNTIGMDQFGKCEHAIMDVLKRARGWRMWRRDLQMAMGSRRFNAEIFNRAIRALETNDRVACYDVTTNTGKVRTVIQCA